MNELSYFLVLDEMNTSMEGHPRGAHVLVFENSEGTYLLVLAPNWARANCLSGTIALEAWQLLHLDVRRIRNDNPADDSFHLFMLRPGFPQDCPTLWREGFSYYRKVPNRAHSLVQELLPISGTNQVRFGRAAPLPVIAEPINLQEVLMASDWAKAYPDLVPLLTA